MPLNSIETVGHGGAIASYGSTQDAINSAAALDGLVTFGYCTASVKPGRPSPLTERVSENPRHSIGSRTQCEHEWHKMRVAATLVSL
ncbi:hypothetical protein BCR33DRAFT_781032 [Rhizoclosmatium globosum]|uniref:Uncharacterized protein n=1 Tax=Rhizoclosmatium globosum TaxID=329046 RepID=A0A1Y2CTP5_9FUNG|nr:hypothetical protein BCR33DRAFT_781032 [Rhizoclosmatium globosum]|eukprot:ORY50266.1 hypothetical protein BCR33DRAFT_781032 [Rhizoclosmatium globosum]